jgi:NADP-dependent 3-hydroxy acid dehydrogenase YdfG
MMESVLQGQKAIILGASGGMGQAIAVNLSEAGVMCALMGRNRGKLDSVAKKCRDVGGKPLVADVDLTKSGSVKDAINGTIEKLQGLSFFIDAAGIHVSAKVQDADLGRWDEMLDANFRNVVRAIHHALPHINASDQGAVIAIGSITSAYSGSAMAIAGKRALTGFFEALFEDVREFGTKVSIIHPGFVNTPMARSDRLKAERMIQPEDIAKTVRFVLEMPVTSCATEITLRPQRSPYVSG